MKHIRNHLKEKHQTVENVETLPLLMNPFEMAALNSFNLVAPFDSEWFKKDYTDWAIYEDLSFQQATSDYTRNLLQLGGPAAESVLPSSPTTLSNWVKSSYEA